MPAIRDGRGVLTVHDMGMPAPGSPSGPVVRVVEPSVANREPARKPKHDNAARMATSRARGAQKAGFVKGATKAKAGEAGGGPGKPPSQVGLKRTPEQRERMRLAMEASWQRRRGTADSQGREAGVPATGAVGRGTPGSPPATLVATPSWQRRWGTADSQGREAGVPATGAVGRGTPGSPPATLVATPLGPPETSAPGIAPEYSAPDSPRPDVLLPCEDCVHALVCSIKPGLESWSRLMGPYPGVPHPAISVQAISVGCIHHLAVPE